MERLSFREFCAARDAFDAAVLATPGISKFCNSSAWLIPAFLELNEYDPDTASTFIFRDGDSWVVFVERSENYFYPFESSWLFACPLIGPDSISVFQRAKREIFPRQRKGFVFGGVPKTAPIQLSDVFHSETFPATDCMIADLGEGVDAWLARRSRKFRRSVREATQKCEGVEIFDVEPSFDRLFEIQQRTQKWADGSDIFHNDDCLRFYRALIADLRAPLRLRVAQVAGNDVAFLLGAVFGETFRGLQMSYVDEVRALGVGNFLQIETMRSVAKNDAVTEFDFGMHSEYKERWTDFRREFVGSFFVV